jgi:hypothetical protein
MIDDNKALEIAQREMSAEIRDGGWPTLYGYADHWVATCMYPGSDRRPSRSIKISKHDGSVS